MSLEIGTNNENTKNTQNTQNTKKYLQLHTQNPSCSVSYESLLPSVSFR